MDYKQAIEIIKSNYPPSNYTMLREALDLAIETLKSKDNVKQTDDLLLDDKAGIS
jgi:hypothetical protein